MVPRVMRRGWSRLVGFRVAVPTCAVKSSRAAEVGREPERPWKCFLMVFLGWVFLVRYIYIYITLSDTSYLFHNI